MTKLVTESGSGLASHDGDLNIKNDSYVFWLDSGAYVRSGLRGNSNSSPCQFFQLPSNGGPRSYPKTLALLSDIPDIPKQRVTVFLAQGPGGITTWYGQNYVMRDSQNGIDWVQASFQIPDNYKSGSGKLVVGAKRHGYGSTSGGVVLKWKTKATADGSNFANDAWHGPISLSAINMTSRCQYHWDIDITGEDEVAGETVYCQFTVERTSGHFTDDISIHWAYFEYETN